MIMNTRRMTRVNELLKREIGGILFRIMNENNFDLSAVSVTHVITSPDLRKARVLVSVRGPEEAKKTMLSLLRRHRPQIQAAIAEAVILKYTPRLLFALDSSLERGDRILNILNHLEPADTSDADEKPDTDNADESDAGDSQETKDDD